MSEAHNNPAFLYHLKTWLAYPSWKVEDALLLLGGLIPYPGGKHNIKWLFTNDELMPHGLIVADAEIWTRDFLSDDGWKTLTLKTAGQAQEYWDRELERLQERTYDLLQNWNQRSSAIKSDTLESRFEVNDYLAWVIEKNLSSLVPWWDSAVSQKLIDPKTLLHSVNENQSLNPIHKNCLIIKSGLCHFTWQGEKLNPISSTKTIRDIGKRLNAPHQQWKPPVSSKAQDAPFDSKAKREISEKYSDLTAKLNSTINESQRESLAEELELFKKGIKNAGVSINDKGEIIWPQNTVDQKYNSFKKNITRGIKKIEESRISDSLTQHLKAYLLPEKYYNPPPDQEIKWNVQMEPEKGAEIIDPLANMSEEEKNQKNFQE